MALAYGRSEPGADLIPQRRRHGSVRDRPDGVAQIADGPQRHANWPIEEHHLAASFQGALDTPVVIEPARARPRGAYTQQAIVPAPVNLDKAGARGVA